MEKIKIMVADDALSQRMVLKNKLSAYEDFEVVGDAVDGADAIDKYQQLNPDVLLLDLVMPNVDGKQALKQIMASDSNAKVIIASSLGGEKDIEECMRMGATSFVQKPYDEEDLVRLIKQATGSEG